MSRNVPDDWNAHYRRCDDCGQRWHMSEGWHDCPGKPPTDDDPPDDSWDGFTPTDGPE